MEVVDKGVFEHFRHYAAVVECALNSCIGLFISDHFHIKKGRFDYSKGGSIFFPCELKILQGAGMSLPDNSDPFVVINLIRENADGFRIDLETLFPVIPFLPDLILDVVALLKSVFSVSEYLVWNRINPAELPLVRNPSHTHRRAILPAFCWVCHAKKEEAFLHKWTTSLSSPVSCM